MLVSSTGTGVVGKDFLLMVQSSGSFLLGVMTRAGLFLASGVREDVFGLLGINPAFFFAFGVTSRYVLGLMGDRTVLRYSNLKDLSPIFRTSLLRMYTSLLIGSPFREAGFSELKEDANICSQKCVA